jgi:hypothetical protein
LARPGELVNDLLNPPLPRFRPIMQWVSRRFLQSGIAFNAARGLEAASASFTHFIGTWCGLPVPSTDATATISVFFNH